MFLLPMAVLSSYSPVFVAICRFLIFPKTGVGRLMKAKVYGDMHLGFKRMTSCLRLQS
jgi:hypothetical protein